MYNPWRVALLIFAVSSDIGYAAVLHVPGDYPGIQTAINASRNGDVVLVSPGIYFENIRFGRKAITLSSTNPADPNVVAATIIRASGQSSTVTFTNGEGSNSVLTGFTITGGYGTVNTSYDSSTYWGGGIYCYRSSPTILGNIIMANFAPTGGVAALDRYGYGPGIACLESAAIITRNVIAANSGYVGGGITTYFGNTKITDNLIYSNSAAFGGGVAMFSGGQLINNTLVGNSADFAGSLYASSDSQGQCLVSDNIICNAIRGGGVYVDSQDKITQVAFNDVWNNTGGDYLDQAETGVNGNISEAPMFVDALNNDYHLRDVSHCINAGDPDFQPLIGDTDFYGSPRLYAKLVDIGASEYSDNFRPLADAGPDQLVTVTTLPASITLDGSASADPNGAALSFHWRQLSGQPVTFTDAAAARPLVSAPALGIYSFELTVDNGRFTSFPDTVEVTVKNNPPIADAGDDQMYSDLESIPSVTLDGSRSFDPELAPLTYHWIQLSGWRVQFNDPNVPNPVFLHPWPGTYLFQLVVNDGLQASKPDLVTVIIGPNHAPVADSGPSRYVLRGNVTLDGTRSYDPDGFSSLLYQWRQISGPPVPIAGTNTPTPVVSVLTSRTTNQICVFELTVSDGQLVSLPSTVTVTIVANYSTNSPLKVVNPPFDPAKPTIVAFGGGNCVEGHGMTFGGVWEELANWITIDSYNFPYTKYGDMLLVYLSSLSPDYRKPIQTMGHSTGNRPAMEVAWYVNTTYRDARYAINRVSLLDAVCNNPLGRFPQFNTNRIDGEQAWVDNYVSNDPNYSPASVVPGTLNVVCKPARYHSYPVDRYSSSSLEYEDGALNAFGYLSVIGSGKNYQLNTSSNKYYFIINSNQSLAFFDQSQYPGKILAPLHLTGPADGYVLDASGATLGCEPVENAVGYQLLFGSNPDRVMDYAIISDTPNPPNQAVYTLTQPHTWWTVRAYDQFGSTIYADPKLLQLPENRPPVANPGPDLVAYAGLEGKATVTLDGSRSIDPDGDVLGFRWAWAVGANAFLSNGVSLIIELPIGTNVVQLMVNDGHVNSEPRAVNVTVIAPLECRLKVTPSTINLRSNGQHILASIRFPDGIITAEADSDVPLLLDPGGGRATRWWAADGDPSQAGIFALFDRGSLFNELREGPAELTVTGKLRTGQLYYGRDTVQIIQNGPAK